MTLPDFDLETAAMAGGASRVCGVDEVGRGPLCGPVVAAAVILDPARIPEGLNDSKKLTAKRREALYAQILDMAIVGVGEATVAEIDEINILQASHLAMIRAIENLAVVPDFALVDGKHLPKALTLPADPVIKGDATSVSIAAASIVAKTWRDRMMATLAQQFPGYGWERNQGYPTKEHLQSIHRLGITPHHRRSFKPIHNILYQAKNLTS
ncbi:ribonuclease HII [Cognatishimia sp. SS12]|uniref:ribonuclease HII n=1 Tax=Cognatishimia sp. SS12 TaxID=2979465 RepID=UPI00232E3CBD|nr:ribonuclease HII [Cognatishimia sp. SS12]MDC0737898.1 ribonuclease HII [Cognatishimia sp. SS12]